MVVRAPQLLSSRVSEETIAGSIACIQSTLLEVKGGREASAYVGRLERVRASRTCLMLSYPSVHVQARETTMDADAAADLPSLLDVVQSHPALICSRLQGTESPGVSSADRISGWMFGIENQSSYTDELQQRIQQLEHYSEVREMESACTATHCFLFSFFLSSLPP